MTRAPNAGLAARRARAAEMVRGGLRNNEIGQALGVEEHCVGRDLAALRRQGVALPRRNGAPSKIVTTTRPCLGCAEDFASAGIHNRLCERCKRAGDAGPFDGVYRLGGDRVTRAGGAP